MVSLHFSVLCTRPDLLYRPLNYNSIMTDVKNLLEELLLKYSKTQSALNELVEARSKLETQFQENKIVHEELEILDDKAKIYKMTGPVLMPQDYEEAKMNVSKRMEFINHDIKRVEEKIESTQKELETLREKLFQVRAQLQAPQK